MIDEQPQNHPPNLQKLLNGEFYIIQLHCRMQPRINKDQDSTGQIHLQGDSSQMIEPFFMIETLPP